MRLHAEEREENKERRNSLLNTGSLAPGGCLCTPTMRNMQTYSLARQQLVSEGHLLPRQNLTNSVAALHTTIVWIPSASHAYRMFMRAHQMCCAYIYMSRELRFKAARLKLLSKVERVSSEPVLVEPGCSGYWYTQARELARQQNIS